MLGHEIDRLGRRFLGWNDEVALVFPIFLVNEDDHLALLNIFDDLVDRGEVVVMG